MDHVAILRKSNIKKGDDLLADILNGRKTIESRWYVNKIAPWGKVSVDETVYFKESGCPISAKGRVSNVIQYDNLNSKIARKIISDYGDQIAPGYTKDELYAWVEEQKDKRYCILIFLSEVEKVQPFKIDKSGFGISSAWMVVGDIENIKC